MKKKHTDSGGNCSPAAGQPVKRCVVCGRIIEWRRKWQKEWGHVKYCSQKCRKAKLTATDLALEGAILELLQVRPRNASICPSEAARLLRPPDQNDSWRALMEPARNAARRLAARNRIVFTQSGRQVEPSTAKGPVRLKLVEPKAD